MDVPSGICDAMPRKLTVEQLQAAVKADDPDCYLYLHEELKLLEPSEEIVRLLVHGAEERVLAANDSGSIALHIACGNIEHISPEILAYLIETCKESLAVANKFGLYPIHKAVAAFTTKNSLPNIRTVAEAYPAALMMRTRDGQVPLHSALHSPKLYSVALVELLVELQPLAAGVADAYGQYPLHKAASKPRVDPGILTVLLEAAPSVVSLKDMHGSLPLHLALSRDCPSLEVVYVLVGAYPEGLFDADYEGNMPYDKLKKRSVSAPEVSPEILALMEFTREQMLARRPKPRLVLAPHLR